MENTNNNDSGEKDGVITVTNFHIKNHFNYSMPSGEFCSLLGIKFGTDFEINRSIAESAPVVFKDKFSKAEAEIIVQKLIDLGYEAVPRLLTDEETAEVIEQKKRAWEHAHEKEKILKRAYELKSAYGLLDDEEDDDDYYYEDDDDWEDDFWKDDFLDDDDDDDYIFDENEYDDDGFSISEENGEKILVSCVADGNVKIPDGVTIINDYAFLSVALMKTLEIPNSVKLIHKYAFLEPKIDPKAVQAPDWVDIEKMINGKKEQIEPTYAEYLRKEQEKNQTLQTKKDNKKNKQANKAPKQQKQEKPKPNLSDRLILESDSPITNADSMAITADNINIDSLNNLFAELEKLSLPEKSVKINIPNGFRGFTDADWQEKLNIPTCVSLIIMPPSFFGIIKFNEEQKDLFLLPSNAHYKKSKGTFKSYKTEATHFAPGTYRCDVSKGDFGLFIGLPLTYFANKWREELEYSHISIAAIEFEDEVTAFQTVLTPFSFGIEKTDSGEPSNIPVIEISDDETPVVKCDGIPVYCSVVTKKAPLDKKIGIWEADKNTSFGFRGSRDRTITFQNGFNIGDIKINQILVKDENTDDGKKMWSFCKYSIAKKDVGLENTTCSDYEVSVCFDGKIYGCNEHKEAAEDLKKHSDGSKVEFYNF